MRGRLPGSSRAFSLLEILITVGVIVILVVIALPVTQSMMETSRRNTCMSNMRHVGQLILTYGADKENSLLPTLEWSSASKSGGNRAWFHFLVEGDYLPKDMWVDRKNGVMSCPSRPEPPFLEKDDKKFFDGMHFGMNMYPGFDNTIVRNQPMRRFTEIARPHRTLLLGESDGRYAVYPKMNNRRLMVYPHDDGCNLFLADGHMEYLKKDLPEPTEEDGYPFY